MRGSKLVITMHGCGAANCVGSRPIDETTQEGSLRGPIPSGARPLAKRRPVVMVEHPALMPEQAREQAVAHIGAGW